MSRIRSIKPEFPQSESMGRVSRDARLLFVLLWTIADDSGRARGNSRMLASLLYPYDDDAPILIEEWLSELEREGCVRRYEVDGSTYLDMPNWLKHQKIDKPSKSRVPEFVEGSRTLAKPRDTLATDLGPRTKDQDLGEDQVSPASQARGSPAASPPPEPEEDLLAIPPILQRPSPAEVKQALDWWNEVAAENGLPQVAKLTDGRRKMLLARLREHGMEGWKVALATVEESAFLLGKKPSNGHPGWRCDFDWLVKEKSFTRVIEGAYSEGSPVHVGH